MSERDELISLNLDTYEREKTYAPFRFVFKERVIVMNDPAEMDWQFLENLEKSSSFITEAMSDEDQDFFLGLTLPAWKMAKLAKDYQDHYGVGDEAVKKG